MIVFVAKREKEKYRRLTRSRLQRTDVSTPRERSLVLLSDVSRFRRSNRRISRDSRERWRWFLKREKESTNIIKITFSSSSFVHFSLRMFGLTRCRHRCAHCCPVRPGNCDATVAHLLPYFSCMCWSFKSSCFVHGWVFSPISAFATECERWFCSFIFVRSCCSSSFTSSFGVVESDSDDAFLFVSESLCFPHGAMCLFKSLLRLWRRTNGRQRRDVKKGALWEKASSASFCLRLCLCLLRKRHAKGDDDDGDGEKEISPNDDDAWKFFCVACLVEDGAKKRRLWLFFTIFWSNHPNGKWLLLLLFWQDHSEERDEERRKKCQHSKHTGASQKSVLEDWWIIYTYIQLPLCKGERLVPASRRVLLLFYVINKASPRAFHSDLRFLKIFLFSHGM